MTQTLPYPLNQIDLTSKSFRKQANEIYYKSRKQAAFLNFLDPAFQNFNPIILKLFIEELEKTYFKDETKREYGG